MDKKETRELKCVLTDEEILTYSKGLAKKQQDKSQADMEKKAAASFHKEKIERFESEINTVSRNVTNGYEFRDVECEWGYDWADGKARLYRNDTGELVDTRAISEYERQQHLELAPPEGAEEDCVATPLEPRKNKRKPHATA